MEQEGLITVTNIEKAIHDLKNKESGFFNPFWIDNENFYRGEMAKAMGFHCTESEIEHAKLRQDGLIKIAQGFNLYLSQFITSLTTKDE